MMKKLIPLFFVSFCFGQQPFDLTPHIEFMDQGWSIGNGCDELFTDYMTTGPIETNGNIIEVMNSSLAIGGQIYENGEIRDPIDLIVEGKVILACLESSISVENETLSTNPVENDFEVTKVFPNPFGDHLNIKAKNVREILLFDINGKRLFGKRTTLETTILNLQFLSPGIYFLIVDFENRDPETIKVIKT